MNHERGTATLTNKIRDAVVGLTVNLYVRTTNDRVSPLRVFYGAQGRERAVFIPGKNFHRHSSENEGKIPVLTYHPLGNAWIGIESAAKILGIKTFAVYKREIEDSSTIAPSPITKDEKILGTSLAPEMMCFPVKAISGHLVKRQEEFEKLRQKARKAGRINPNNHYQVFITDISNGSCKEREYHCIEEAILSDQYAQRKARDENVGDFDFYGAGQTQDHLKETIKFLAKLAHTDEYHAALAINEGIQRTKAAELLQAGVLWEQSIMEKVGINEAERILNEAKDELASQLDLDPAEIVTKHLSRVKELPKRKVMAIEDGRLVEKKATEPHGKTFVTGEIFHCAEAASSSADVIRMIVEQGFYPHIDIGLGHYLKNYEINLLNIIRTLNPVKNDPRKGLLASAGLTEGRDPGGHCLDIIAGFQAIKEGQLDFIDVLVFSPFLCAPDTIAQNYTLLKEWPFTSLWLSFDAHTGTEGVRTRIEAHFESIIREKQISMIAQIRQIRAAENKQQKEEFSKPGLSPHNSPNLPYHS